MSHHSRTAPLAAVNRGIVAGAAGTALMTGYQLVVAKLRGRGSSSAPAEVGKRIIEAVFKRDVPGDRMEALNNAMHVAYGTSWGPVYGIAEPILRLPACSGGTLFGALVWGASLVELPAMGIAPPIWKTPPAEAALDLSYHLVYGLGTAATYSLLDRR